MSKLTQFATPLMAVALMSSAPFMTLAQNNQTQNSSAQDWNAPPEGTEQAQAYRDGIEAAKLDKVAKRPIDPTKSHLYVHPPVKGNVRDAYRSSFTKGYQAAVQHDTAS